MRAVQADARAEVQNLPARFAGGQGAEQLCREQLATGIEVEFGGAGVELVGGDWGWPWGHFVISKLRRFQTQTRSGLSCTLILKLPE